MNLPTETQFGQDEFRRRHQLLSNPAFRQRVRQHDLAALAEVGYIPREGADVSAIEIKVVTSPPDVLYVPMSRVSDDTIKLTAGQLEQIRAAGGSATASTAGTLSSLGSVSTAISCLGTVSTGGTAGTGGSAAGSIQ